MICAVTPFSRRLQLSAALLLLWASFPIRASAEDKAPSSEPEEQESGNRGPRESTDVKKIAHPLPASLAKTLEVPYYGQASTKWCWAASLAMLEGYYGFSDKTWEIGSDFGVDVKGIKFIYRDIPAYLKGRHGVSAEYETYYDTATFNHDLRKSLDQGMPVWLGLPSVGHAVVAVGYDKNRLYVHDPSGLLAGKSGNFAGAEDKWRVFLNGKLAGYGILWENWENTLERLTATHSAGDYFVGSVQPVAKFLRITSVDPNPKPLSIQLYPHTPSESRSIELGHFGKSLSYKWLERTAAVAFEWEPTPPGVSFTHLSPVRAQKPAVCNSDRLLFLRPFVSNSSLQRRAFTVRAFLDGNVLAEAKGVVDPKTSDQPVELSKPDGLLSLDQKPLSVGEHRLRFELFEGDRVADWADIPFPVAPAPVKGLKVRRAASDLLELTWNPGTEPGLQYQVFSSPGKSLDSARLEGTTDKVRFTVRLTGEEKRGWNKPYYSLWAADPASGLGSQEADFVKAQGAPEECADLEPGSGLEKGQYYAALEKYRKCIDEGRDALEAMPEPGKDQQPGASQKDLLKRECVDCVNGLIGGDCYVRIPTLAGWGLSLSCVKGGGVSEENRFLHKNKCPACDKVDWDLCDFKPAPKDCVAVCKPMGSCSKRDGGR